MAHEQVEGAGLNMRHSAHHKAVTMFEELQSFLLRRQLLGMERKQIQALLKEVESELTEERKKLFAFRSHLAVPATPPVVLQRRPEAVPPRKTTLKDWPRILERYVRNKRKRLFAPFKRGGAEPRTITDTTSAHDEQPHGWHVPSAREVDAWVNLFAAFGASTTPHLRLRESRLQAAFIVGGGIGDVLKSTSVLASIVDRFSCDITYITNQNGAAELLENNPYVKHVICNLDQYDLADNILKYIPAFDLVITWRYVVQFYVPPKSRIDYAVVRLFNDRAIAVRSTLLKYVHLCIWPSSNHTFSCEMARLGMRIHDVSTITSGQPTNDSNPYGIPFFPTAKALRIVSEFLSKSYITVHNGFDRNNIGARRRKTNYASTKNISVAQWRDIVLKLRRANIQIIQLGVVEENEIPGVSYYLNGQTSLSETALLLKHAICHIDTEGGLVHLARAVHARSVVLFGPTPAEVFGYPQNINLEPPDCKGCWFVTSHWPAECPRHTNGPQCMRGHSTERVAQAVNTIMSEDVMPAAHLISAETGQLKIPYAKLIAATGMLLDSDPARKILLILDVASYATAMELPADVLGKIDIMVCPDQAADWDPASEVGGRVECGSLLNVPRASASVEGVIWLSSALEVDVAPFVIREIFRILKIGGEVSFIGMGAVPSIDLRAALRLAKIGHNESDMPSHAVDRFSLRKSTAKADVHDFPRAWPIRPTPPTRIPTVVKDRDPQLSALEAENSRQMTVVYERFLALDNIVDEMWGAVDDTIARQIGADGWIPVSDIFGDGYSRRFFLTGWHPAEDWGIWGRDQKCILMLPVPTEPNSQDRRLQLEMEAELPLADAFSPRTIRLGVSDGPFASFQIAKTTETIAATILLEKVIYRGVVQVEIHVDRTVCPKASGLSPDDRDLALGIRRFRYRVLSGRSAEKKEN